jgi:LuxR family maltose regulon positive regulatory protein
VNALTAEGLPAALLGTKLGPPALPGDLVSRPSLLALLAVPLRPLTLVEAPAGFGKTTLLAEWTTVRRRPVAWLSLDDRESDLVAFVRAAVAAIQTLFPGAGRTTLSLLQLPELPPVGYVATTLGNELAELPGDLVLLLDDYQTIDDPDVHALLTRLLRHLPANVSLVIATREEPGLSLGALRARGQVTEIRTDALRFRPDEVRTFLRGALATDPADETVAALHGRTEGWIVGLRLAALALRDGGDGAAVLRAFQAGSHRYVEDFLLEEVFALQPPAVQRFLLSTAICERFCAALGDALLEPEGSGGASQTLLAHLARANLFLTPLDGEPRWYRYDHLFRAAMQRRLQTQCDSAAVMVLHRRASAWFGEQGLIDEAVQHALAGEEPGEAVRLVEASVHPSLNREGWPQLERWLRLLPSELVEQRPALLLARAWTFHFRSRIAALPPLLKVVDTRLGALASTLDPAAARALHAESDTLWAAAEFYAGDALACLERSQRALERLPADRAYAGGIAAAGYGMAAQALGESDAAIRWLAAARAEGAGATPVYDVRLLLALAYNHVASGNLSALGQTALEIVSLAAEHGLPLSLAWGHYALARVAYERNALESARDQFAAVLELRHRAHHRAIVESTIGLALAEQALGRPEVARRTAQDLVASALEANDAPRALVARSFQARLALLQGDQATAAAWLRTAPEPVPARFPQDLEHPAVTRARVLLALGSEPTLAQAATALAALVAACESTHDAPRLIEVLALQALAYAARGEPTTALETLQRAIGLAEPGGYVRTFVDCGPPMASLLRRLGGTGLVPEYLRRLLASLEPTVSAATAVVPSRRSAVPALVEPLTGRESQILELLVDRLSDKEIAKALGISALTVRKHTYNLYQKLQVSGRREAVAQAQALGLLPQT